MSTSARLLTALLAVALTAGATGAPAAAQPDAPTAVLAPAEADRVDLDDDIAEGLAVGIPGVAVIDDVADDPTATSLAISRETFLRTDRVLIARSDQFADALASGVLQGGPSPLILVDPDQPVRADVVTHLASVEATEAVLLGGVGALEPVVEDSLRDLGLAVRRIAGADRTSTAVAIAADAATGSSTALLARAFPAADAVDPSQAWADSLAAGAWSAGTGHPVLLTASETLSAATRAHLLDGGYERVRVIGGASAISDAVVTELEALGLVVDRVSGSSRIETALAIADAWDAEVGTTGGGALTAGQAADDWTFGLPLAAAAAARDLRVLVAPTTGVLPPPILDRLVPAARRTRQGGPLVDLTSTSAGALLGGLLLQVLVIGVDSRPRALLVDAGGAPVGVLDRDGGVGIRIPETRGDAEIVVEVISSDGDRGACGPIAADRTVIEGSGEAGDPTETFYVLSVPGLVEQGCPPLPQDGLLALSASLDGGSTPLDVDVIIEIGGGLGDPLLVAAATSSDVSTRIEVLRGEATFDAPVTQEQVDVPRVGGRLDALGGNAIVLATDDRGSDLPGLVRAALPVGGGEVGSAALQALWTGMDGGLVTNPSVSPSGRAVAFSFSHLPSSSTPEFVGAIRTDGMSLGQVDVADPDGFGLLNDQAWQGPGTFVYWAGGEAQAGRDEIRRATLTGLRADGTEVQAGTTALVDGGARPAAAPTGIIDRVGLGGPDIARLIDTDDGPRGTVGTFPDEAVAASAATFSPSGEAFAQVRYDADGSARLVIVAMDFTILDEETLPDAAGLAPTGPSTDPEWGPYRAIAIPGAEGVILVGVDDDGFIYEGAVLYPSDRAPMQDVAWVPRVLSQLRAR